MESVNGEIVNELKKAIRSGSSFAALLLPWEHRYRLFATGGDGKAKFIMREFNGGSDGKVVEMGEIQQSEFGGSVESVVGNGNEYCYESTDKESYIKGASAIINDLKARGGKTVYSRVITLDSRKDPIDVMLRYHRAHPSTFRYICNSSEFGLWFGATPELVMRSDVANRKIETMALAGTREKGGQTVWDSKNSDEHEFVTNHIVDVFRKFNLEVSVSEGESLQFGDIEHLMHLIEGRGCFDSRQVLDALTPTPAICGVEKSAALKHIEKFESHNRLCYGGEVGMVNGDMAIFYANLRCANVRYAGNGKWRYAVIVGGGLTADSDVDTEWEETEMKAKSLLDIIENKHKEIYETI